MVHWCIDFLVFTSFKVSWKWILEYSYKQNGSNTSRARYALLLYSKQLSCKECHSRWIKIGAISTATPHEFIHSYKWTLEKPKISSRRGKLSWNLTTSYSQISCLVLVTQIHHLVQSHLQHCPFFGRAITCNVLPCLQSTRFLCSIINTICQLASNIPATTHKASATTAQYRDSVALGKAR